jgi:hypothetical protein
VGEADNHDVVGGDDFEQDGGLASKARLTTSECRNDVEDDQDVDVDQKDKLIRNKSKRSPL